MQPKRPAGLGVRLCAGLIDLAFSAVIVILLAEAVAEFGVYVPLEITVITVYAMYTGVGIAWKGRTLGKAALGIRVTCRDGARVGPVRAAVRSMLVALSPCLLGLPLLLMGAGRLKRGGHDRLAGTIVVRQEGLEKRRRIVGAAVMVVVGVSGAASVFDGLRLYRMNRAWVVDAEAAAARTFDPSTARIEAASVGAAERQQMASWLAEHKEDPAQTLVNLAATHPVTIVGEFHGKKAFLNLLNEVIPDLYSRAGMRTLALECCHPDQNKDLERLVQGPQFDRRLLLTLARGRIHDLSEGNQLIRKGFHRLG